MAKRLAITIAGAVSLGSYEAGVLYEVLDAIHRHNTDPLTIANPQDRIVIDVLTGASAGGMTAIILAQKLLYSAQEFVGPYDNPLYNVWVKRIDLSGLQQTQVDESPLQSLFSSDLIETISNEMLMARYATLPPPPPVQHAASDGSIRVGVALTNLNGVDYFYPVRPSGRFVYRDHADQMTRTAGLATDNPDFWTPLRQAAVACGAFPIAFRPQDVSRSQHETDDYPPANLLKWSTDPTTYTYCDGGVLQNQPLGMAKNLVDLIDTHNDQENRFYLFVSPHATDPAKAKPFAAVDADYLTLIGRLIGTVIGQSGFHDWIKAESINTQVALLDNRATHLADILRAHAIEVDSLQKTADSLLLVLFQNGRNIAPGSQAPESLAEAKDRIATQYSQEMADVTRDAGPAAAAAFRDSILTFESAAGLGARDLMTIYGITATNSELSGVGLASFLGFFDQVFRDHDYDIGRQHAQGFLLSDLSGPDQIGPLRLNLPLQPIRPILPVSDVGVGGTLGNTPDNDVQEFRDGTKARVNEMLTELIHGWGAIFRPGADLAADAILKVIIDQLVKKG